MSAETKTDRSERVQLTAKGSAYGKWRSHAGGDYTDSLAAFSAVWNAGFDAGEEGHGRTIDERDVATDWADKLAYAIAPQSVIGEHTSANNPWENAEEHALRTQGRLEEALMGASDYEHLRDLVIEQLNPPDDDAAEVSIVADAIERAVTWIDQQPCDCPAAPDDLDYDEVCGRCHVLGRSRDVQVPR